MMKILFLTGLLLSTTTHAVAATYHSCSGGVPENSRKVRILKNADGTFAVTVIGHDGNIAAEFHDAKMADKIPGKAAYMPYEVYGAVDLKNSTSIIFTIDREDDGNWFGPVSLVKNRTLDNFNIFCD